MPFVIALLTSFASLGAAQTVTAVSNVSTSQPSGSPGQTIRVTVDSPPAGNYCCGNTNTTILNNTFVRLLDSSNTLVVQVPVTQFIPDDDADPLEVEYFFNVPIGVVTGTYRVVVHAQLPAAAYTTPVNASRTLPLTSGAAIYRA